MIIKVHMMHWSTEKYYSTFPTGCTRGIYCMDVKLSDGMSQVCTNMTVTESRKFMHALVDKTRVQKLLEFRHSPMGRNVLQKVIIADCYSNTVHQALQNLLIHSEPLTSYRSTYSLKVAQRKERLYFGTHCKV